MSKREREREREGGEGEEREREGERGRERELVSQIESSHGASSHLDNSTQHVESMF